MAASLLLRRHKARNALIPFTKRKRKGRDDMKIDLNGRSISCCREVFRQKKLASEQAESIVPDVFDDVGQISRAEAQICLNSKEIEEDGIRIRARAEICVFYITEDRERIRSVKISKDMEIFFECPSIPADGIVQVAFACRQVQARALNPRKITAQIMVETDLSCWCGDSFSLPCEVNAVPEDGLELRVRNTECLLTVQACEKTFSVQEQLPLPSDREVTEIVGSCADLFYTSHQLIGSRALLRGEAEVRIAYTVRENGMPLFLKQCVPFSVLLDMPHDNCGLGRVSFVPTAVYAGLDQAINGAQMIGMEIRAVAQVCSEKRESLDYLSDAYSTHCPVNTDAVSAEILLRQNTERLTARAADSFQPSESGELTADAFAEIRSVSLNEDKAAATVSIDLLFRGDDGSFFTQQRTLSCEAALPEKGGEITGARLLSVEAAAEGDSVSVETAVEFLYLLSERKDIRFLSSLDLKEEESYDPAQCPSVTVVKRGDRELWDLAKLYRSSTELIEAMNKAFPMSEGLLLIPKA